MSESWRLLDLGVTDPYETQPLAEVLLTALKGGFIPNTLCVCKPKRLVFLGHKGSLGKVNLEYCQKEQIPIIRAFVGGGVGVYDENTVGYYLVSRSDALNLELLMNCLVESLLIMGLKSEVKAKSNNILVNGKKISGTSLTRFGEFIIFGGSVVVDFNHDFCENALMPLPEKFRDKEVKSHREYVTTVKKQLGREVSYDEAVSALKEGFEKVLQVEFNIAHSFNEAERQILEGLREKYQSEQWNRTGRWSPVKDYWRPK